MAKFNPRSPRNPIKLPKLRAADQPATRRMLGLVRDELKEEIKGVRDELKEEIKGVRDELKEEIKGVRADIKRLDRKFSNRLIAVEARLQGKIGDLTKDISSIKTMVHQSNLLVEEQNANNRIVLEGLQALWERQEKYETA